MVEVIRINRQIERQDKDEAIMNLTIELESVEKMISALKRIEHYLMAIGKPPEVIAERVNLKARKCFLINKQIRLKG